MCWIDDFTKSGALSTGGPLNLRLRVMMCWIVA